MGKVFTRTEAPIINAEIEKIFRLVAFSHIQKRVIKKKDFNERYSLSRIEYFS